MKKKLLRTIAIILIVAALCLFVAAYFALNKKDNKKPVKEVKTVDNIQTKEFDYVLYDSKSDLYKEYFGKLKEELLKDEVNDEEYAKIISQLFTIDFYSLNDKKTSTDIGGLDFIYEDMKENFTIKAVDTIYKYVESNVYGERKQTLPKVTGSEIKTITKKNININGATDPNGYVAVVTINYEKDLGYPKEVMLTLVHKENKLYIVEVK